MDVLREVMEPPDQPYQAEVTVQGGREAGVSVPPRLMVVSFSPPNLYRRETRDASGAVQQLVVEDGRSEWIYDPVRRKAWQGPSADPLFKRFGPDEEIDLISENYEVSIATGERVAVHPTWRLELRSRTSAALARRLWVDRKSFIVLRDETFRPDGSLGDSIVFTSLSAGAPLDPELFRFSPPAGGAVVRRGEPDYLGLDEAKAAAGVEPRLPAWLPSGYVFESLDVIPKGRRNVVHYRFSDGMGALSLFQCPPRVRLNFGGRQRQRVKLSVGRGYRTQTPEGNVLVWNSRGSHFVLIGPLSDDILRRVAESVR
jgi:outer membrane lipoprotein-sorting protein